MARTYPAPTTDTSVHRAINIVGPTDDSRQRPPDISMAKAALNQAPVAPLDQGLRPTIDNVAGAHVNLRFSEASADGRRWYLVRAAVTGRGRRQRQHLRQQSVGDLSTQTGAHRAPRAPHPGGVGRLFPGLPLRAEA